MEYQNNEEVENLQRQLREEENRTSLAHDEIRRLHRVCQAKDDEISELQENIEYWKTRCADACREKEHPVFIQDGTRGMLIDTDAPWVDIDKWLSSEKTKKDYSLVEYLKSCHYEAFILWDSQNIEYPEDIIITAMEYRKYETTLETEEKGKE